MDEGLAYEANNPDHFRVVPERRRVLVWYNMHPYTERIDDRTMHAEAAVTQREKKGATVFICNCNNSPSETKETESVESMAVNPCD